MNPSMPSPPAGGFADKFQLRGRCALVTGASKGIGLGIAHAMAAAGADVILVARSQAKLETAAGTLRETGRQVRVCPFDLRNTDEIPAWFAKAIETHGRPDILVNAAGITRRAPAEELTNERGKQRCPLARWGTPEEIAWPTVFLASSAADFMTGQVLFVDGGWMATF